MENKLAEVWETNPTERMHLLERMWQHSMHKRGVDRSLVGYDCMSCQPCLLPAHCSSFIALPL